MREALAHLVGDYVAQSHWMASKKTSENLPAAIHAATYAACFLPLTRDWRRLAVIGGSHYLIDRYRLARHVSWLKNQAGPAAQRPGHTATGYSDETPDWLAFWLLIITDNTMHLLINHVALNARKDRK
jgi:hypothetical protein